MNDRERFIVRLALIYLSMNLEAANAEFRDDSYYDDTMLNVNGDEGSPVSDGDVEELLMSLQG